MADQGTMRFQKAARSCGGTFSGVGATLVCVGVFAVLLGLAHLSREVEAGFLEALTGLGLALFGVVVLSLRGYLLALADAVLEARRKESSVN